MFNNVAPEKIFLNRPSNPKHELVDFNLKNLNGGHLALGILIFWAIRVFISDLICKKKEK
jgi:hypothetical protein